jgi:dipeptidase
MDWLPTASLGEYSHPYYSLRRVWRALSLAAPSLKLDPWVRDGQGGLTRDYPFSVKPDKPITREFLMAMHRDHYDGTEFDLTKGAAAGPWGNPNRYLGTNDPGGDVGDPNAKLAGAWERPLGCYYTNVTWINELQPGLPHPINQVCWIALNSAAESVFVPLAVADLPEMYQTYDYRVFGIDSQAWRVYNMVGEYVNLRYNGMMEDVRREQQTEEKSGAALVTSLQNKLKSEAARNPERTAREYGQALNANALKVHTAWRTLFEQLVVNFNQGEINNAAPGEKADFGKGRYPDEWLETTNYYSGPTGYGKKR